MENPRPISGIPNNQVATPQAVPAAPPVPHASVNHLPPPQSPPPVHHPADRPTQHTPTHSSEPKSPAPKKDDKLDLSMIKSSTWYMVFGGIIGIVVGGLLSLVIDASLLGYGFAVGIFLGYGLGYWKERNK